MLPAARRIPATEPHWPAQSGEYGIVTGTLLRTLALGAIALAGTLLGHGTAQAASVTFQWVPLAGNTTSGTLTLASASAIADPNNFTLTGTSSATAASA